MSRSHDVRHHAVTSQLTFDTFFALGASKRPLMGEPALRLAIKRPGVGGAAPSIMQRPCLG